MIVNGDNPRNTDCISIYIFQNSANGFYLHYPVGRANRIKTCVVKPKLKSLFHFFNQFRGLFILPYGDSPGSYIFG